MTLQSADPEIAGLINREKQRQREMLGLIPSENYASKAVREAVGSVFMNKYAEGLPRKRYYQGNRNADELEMLCQKRALSAFALKEADWGVNVQALSGSPANLAVYNALLSPGDTIMSMYLPDGGHLSHGWAVNGKKTTLTSRFWNVVWYHVNPETRVFDYDAISRQAEEVKPRLIISGGTAYPREINHKRMGEIAHAVGAYYLADIAHEAGLVAAGVNTSPFPYADAVTMTTHKTLRGPRGALIFARTQFLDAVNAGVFPGMQGGPHLHTIAGIAVALGEVQTPAFRRYARQVIANAAVLAEEFVKAGYDVVSGGTDKHLVLIDLRPKNTAAWVAAWALEYANIVVNRNTVPNETAPPYYPSGLRMGTPAATTRGMKEPEMRKIAAWIVKICETVKDIKIPEDREERKAFLKTVHEDLKSRKTVRNVAAQVKSLTAKFPIP